MANQYSNLYGTAPNANSTVVTYAGPTGQRPGQSVLRYSTFTGTIANADVLYIAGGFVAGEKLVRFTAIRSADGDTDNDATFNLGWRLGTGSEFLAASTGFQAAVAVAIAADVAMPIAAASEGDDLILTNAAGEIEVSTTHRFLIESVIPNP
jgi:hypothetical protein